MVVGPPGGPVWRPHADISDAEDQARHLARGCLRAPTRGAWVVPWMHSLGTVGAGVDPPCSVAGWPPHACSSIIGILCRDRCPFSPAAECSSHWEAHGCLCNAWVTVDGAVTKAGPAVLQGHQNVGACPESRCPPTALGGHY